jgi:lycopene cyclase domain-containing protein
VSYTACAALAIILATVLDQLVLRTGLLRRRSFWTAYAIVLSFQLVVNGLLTGLRIVRYDRHAILGRHVAYAPVEDLGFGFAMVTATLSLWVWAGRRAARVARAADPAAPPSPGGSGPPGRAR